MSNIWWGTCTIVGACVIVVALLCLAAMLASAWLERPHKRAAEAKEAEEMVTFFKEFDLIPDHHLNGVVTSTDGDTVYVGSTPNNVIDFQAKKLERSKR